MNTIRYSRREALHHHCFNKMTLYPRRYFVGLLAIIIVLIAFQIWFGSSIISLPVGISVLIITLIMIGFPIGFAFYVGRSKQWFSKAFVIDEAGEFWLACQYGDVRTDAQDDLYEKIVTASIHKKKCKEGVAIPLKNFRIVEERENITFVIT